MMCVAKANYGRQGMRFESGQHLIGRVKGRNCPPEAETPGATLFLSRKVLSRILATSPGEIRAQRGRKWQAKAHIWSILHTLQQILMLLEAFQ